MLGQCAIPSCNTDGNSLVISVVKSPISGGTKSPVKLLNTTRPFSTLLKSFSTAGGLFVIVVFGTVSPACCASRNWEGLQFIRSTCGVSGFIHRAWERYIDNERSTDIHSLETKFAMITPKDKQKSHLLAIDCTSVGVLLICRFPNIFRLLLYG